MSEVLKNEWRKALWTLIAAGLLSIAGTIGANIVTTATLKERIKTIETEQGIIRNKVDLIQIQLEKKVPREKLDECLRDMDSKLDDIHNEFEVSLRDLNQNVYEIYKILK